jgi:hypothetical protein
MMKTVWKNNHAFSNAIVEFCYIFTSIALKQYEIKNGRHYFPNNPHTCGAYKHLLLVALYKISLLGTNI